MPETSKLEQRRSDRMVLGGGFAASREAGTHQWTRWSIVDVSMHGALLKGLSRCPKQRIDVRLYWPGLGLAETAAEVTRRSGDTYAVDYTGRNRSTVEELLDYVQLEQQLKVVEPATVLYGPPDDHRHRLARQLGGDAPVYQVSTPLDLVIAVEERSIAVARVICHASGEGLALLDWLASDHPELARCAYQGPRDEIDTASLVASGLAEKNLEWPWGDADIEALMVDDVLATAV